MTKHIEGKLILTGESIAVVVARFNDLITTRLLAGALDTLSRHGASNESITVVHVPGSFEIPLAADRVANSGKFDAVICLGAVIRGETTHDVHINTTVSAQLGQLMTESGKPVAFGVLTCNNLEQAIQRSGGSVGNKGYEAVDAAVEMLRLIDRVAPE